MLTTLTNSRKSTGAMPLLTLCSFHDNVCAMMLIMRTACVIVTMFADDDDNAHQPLPLWSCDARGIT